MCTFRLVVTWNGDACPCQCEPFINFVVGLMSTPFISAAGIMSVIVTDQWFILHVIALPFERVARPGQLPRSISEWRTFLPVSAGVLRGARAACANVFFPASNLSPTRLGWAFLVGIFIQSAGSKAKLIMCGWRCCGCVSRCLQCATLSDGLLSGRLAGCAFLAPIQYNLL